MQTNKHKQTNANKQMQNKQRQNKQMSTNKNKNNKAKTKQPRDILRRPSIDRTL